MPLSGIRRLWWLPKCFLFVFRLFPGTTRTLMSIPSCDPACHCCSCWEWNKYNTSLLYGRNERQRLRHIRYLAKQKKCDFFYFFLHCVALRCESTTEVNRDCTVPHLVRGTVIAHYKALALLNYSVVLSHSMLLLWISFTSMCCHIFIFIMNSAGFILFYFGKKIFFNFFLF